MKLMKKTLSLLLSIILSLSMLALPTGAYADTVDSGKCGNNIRYTLYSNGELKLTGSGKMYDYDALESPFARMMVGDEMFGEGNSAYVSKITIGNGITYIGKNAFGCDENNSAETVSISIPSSVTAIGESAFTGLSVKKLSIPSSVKTIPRNCFTYITVSDTLTIKGATSIKSYAFSNANINRIVLPKKLKSIADTAFYSHFEFDFGIKSISVQKENKNYADYKGALYNKKKTTLIYYPSAKSSYQLAKGVKTIRKYAFNGSCLKTVKLPSTVTSIGEAAFQNSAIKQISIPGKVKKIPKSCFADCPNLKDVSIPNSVTEIGDFAFSWAFLESIDIPNSVKKIGNANIAIRDFYSNGKGITIPASVKTIGDLAVDVDEGWEPMVNYIAGYKNSAAEKYAKKIGVTFIVAPAKGTITSVTSPKRGGIELHWKRVSGAKGYQYQISTSSTMSENTKSGIVKGGKMNGCGKQGWKSGKTYYVQVRAYKTKKINGKTQKIYGSWSALKKIKVR